MDSTAAAAVSRAARRRGAVLAGAALLAVSGGALAGWFSNDGDDSTVNAPRTYPKRLYGKPLDCIVDAAQDLGTVDRRIFGTNLEWFNDAGGLASSDLDADKDLVDRARDEGITVYRFPGGTLADYYDWRDGIGPRNQRPVRRHPTDPGASPNNFGSPELFRFLKQTFGQALMTVNAGTGTAADAAGWVAYANRPGDSQRRADGFPDPIGIKLWEVGNELYLPGDPGEKPISVTPEVYAQRVVEFADAMRAVDPTISVLAIGVARSHSGPDTQYPDWTETLLKRAADRIDMIAVHSAYFPLLYGVHHPAVTAVYPALWATPEAVDRSLDDLETLIHRYEGRREIGIAITEWGALFSLPMPAGDRSWVDHVKTLGTGVYVGRLLQVFMSHPRVKLANYFKLTDRSFMGWVDYAGNPKVPYWVFELYARNSGDLRVQAAVDSPTFDTPALAVMLPETQVREVTVVATRSSVDGTLYVNFVNRSLADIHTVRLDLRNFTPAKAGDVLSVSGNEPTASDGRDIPPEWPYKQEYEPYSTASPGSIGIVRRPWSVGDAITLQPFSVATLVLKPTRGPSSR